MAGLDDRDVKRCCLGTKNMWVVMGLAILLMLAFVAMQTASQLNIPLRSSDAAGAENSLVVQTYERHWQPLNPGKYALPITGDDEDTRMRYPTVTKSLIVRSVYHDPRPRNTGHDNATVFLVAGSKEILTGGHIVKCQLGSMVTSSLTVRILEEGSLSHKEALVDCYDLPVEGTGIRAFLHYKEDLSKNELYSAESEKRFDTITTLGMLSAYTCNRTGDCYISRVSSPPSVVACVAMLHYGNPPSSQYRLFYKWLDHLEAIGVDHVHILTEHSFLAREGFANSYIFNAVKRYYLSVIFWQSFLNDTDVKNHSKVLAYNDCVYRYMGLYDYILLADWNHFFMPYVTSNSSLQDECDSLSGCRFGTQRGTAHCGRDGSPEVVSDGEGLGDDSQPVFLHRLEHLTSVGWQTEGTAWTTHTLSKSSAIFKKLKCG